MSSLVSMVNRIALVAILLTPLTGCGEAGRGGMEINGNVLVDGQPMPAGSIVLEPIGQGHRVAGEINAGSFEISADVGPVPGEYRVKIYSPVNHEVPLDDPVAFAQSRIRHPAANPLPARYNEETTLQAQVTAEENLPLTFELTTKR